MADTMSNSSIYQVLTTAEDDVISIESADQLHFLCRHYSRPEFFIRTVMNLTEAVGFGSSDGTPLSEWQDKISLPGLLGNKKYQVNGVLDESDLICHTVSNGGNGIFLVHQNEDGSKFQMDIVSDWGYSSYLNRARKNCEYNRKWEKTKNCPNPPSAEERAADINVGARTSVEEVTIYCPDGVVDYIYSNVGVVLPYDKGIEAFEKGLKGAFPDSDFLRGEITHSYIWADYLLNDPVAEDAFVSMMQKQNSSILSGRLIARFSSGNVGDSKMVYRLLMEVTMKDDDNRQVKVMMPLTESIGIWHHKQHSAPVLKDKNGAAVIDPVTKKPKKDLDHTNGCEIEDFGEKVTWVEDLIKESEDHMEILSLTKVAHPAGFAQHFLKEKCNNYFTKEVAQKAVARINKDFPKGSECTAMDIYVILSDAACTLNGAKACAEAAVHVASMQFAPNLAAYDKPLRISED